MVDLEEGCHRYRSVYKVQVPARLAMDGGRVLMLLLSRYNHVRLVRLPMDSGIAVILLLLRYNVWICLRKPMDSGSVVCCDVIIGKTQACQMLKFVSKVIGEGGDVAISCGKYTTVNCVKWSMMYTSESSVIPLQLLMSIFVTFCLSTWMMARIGKETDHMAVSQLRSVIGTQSIKEVHPCSSILQKVDLLDMILRQNKRIRFTRVLIGRH